MAFDNYLKSSLVNRPTWNVAGADTIVFVKSDTIQQIVTVGGNDSDLVEDIILRSGEKWNLFDDLEGVTYTLTTDTSKNGTVYTAEIGFTVAIQTVAKNRVFDQLRETDVVAIVRDGNERWWMVGHEQPLKLTSQEQRVDADGNQYVIKLRTTQRENVKGMAPAWVEVMNQMEFWDAVDSVDGAHLSVTVTTALNNGGQNPGPINQLPNNIQNYVIAPPTNYVILDSIGIVAAKPGTTIKLPTVAQNGQQHTIKDYTGAAGTATITINGNGRLIDGFPQAKINTDGGTMTVTFIDNAWAITTPYLN